MWWVAILLIVLCVIILVYQREDPRMTELKKRYYSFIGNLPDKYSVLRKPVIITGLTGQPNQIGSNVNKGAEINICLDGDINDQFHILLHELAHSTVSEYDHSDKFWANFTELKDIARTQGLYSNVEKKTYCGQVISDDQS